MAKLVDPYHDLGYNVINVRLAGHGTVPEDLISTTPADMMKSVENAVGIAGKLGDRVVLAGHSAGAVLAAEYTAAHQGQIAGLDLYAPTFRFSTNMQKFIRARATQTWLSGLERETPTGYDRTSSAAYIRLLEHWDTIGPKLVGQKLGVPIRLTTTDRDIFADQESTEAFAQTNEIPQSQRVKYPRTNRAVNHNTLPATFDQPEVTAGLRIFDAQIR
jgi:pimeloyl-ACP methyl ester carboxylesterase